MTLASRDAGQVRPAAARDHRGDAILELGGGEESRRRAGAGAEKPERQFGDVRLAAEIERGLDHAFRKQRDIEDIAAVVGLVRRQQVEQQRGEAVGVERVRDGEVARAEPARSAAVGEEHEAARVRRQGEIADEVERRHRNLTPGRGRRARTRIRSARPALAQQTDGLRIGELVEVVVESADAVEMPSRVKAHHEVGLLADLPQGILRRHRDGDADLGGPLPLHRDQRRLHGRAGREAVVDQDRGPAGRIDLRAVAKVEGPAPLDLRKFPCTGALEKDVVRAGAAAHLLVDHRLGVLAVDDGAERHFRRAGGTDLSHEDKVERGTQGAGDLERDRHAAPRQRVDNRPLQRHRQQPCRQLPASIGSVFEPEAGEPHAMRIRAAGVVALIWRN